MVVALGTAKDKRLGRLLFWVDNVGDSLCSTNMLSCTRQKVE